MSEFSTLPTTLQHSPVATENMKTLKKENTSFESMRSSGHPSPHLSSPQLEAWASFTSFVLSSTRGMGIIHPICPLLYWRHGHHSPHLSSPQLEAWASFTPFVLSSTGGMGSMATTTYKRLASLLADKWGSSYSQTMGWLHLSYDHPYSASCIRGA